MHQPVHGSSPYYVPDTRRKKIGCGSGCLIVVIAILIFSKGSAWWGDFSEKREANQQEQEQADKRAEIQEKLDKFGREYAPVLLGAIEDLEDFEAKDRKRLEKLTTTLTALGREPEGDPDWRRLKNRLREVEGKQAELTRKLEDAYLLYQKYLINLEPSEQARYEEAIQSGEAAARETSRALEELLRDSESGR